ncbi:uncharacterized protein LOC134752807 isoform X3 [Cydia strobilella]|uniref:uncharacterized protein LOC134752807 isoform X3 n=1 Tax=Cydia strobilella TaxID=1100964 RepID=UPI003006E2D4
MGRARKGVRKMGNHTEEDMRTALSLIKSGLSIRHASTQCHLSYATVRRYLVSLKKNEGKPIRLTPNYEVNRVFSADEEDCLVKYIKKGTEKFKGLTAEGFSSRDCRRLAYEMAKIINKKIPQGWINANMAGMEWLRSFRNRHELLFVKRKAGEIMRQTVFDNDDMEAFFGHLKIVKQETVSVPGAQPLPGPSRIPNTQTSDTNVSPKDQDPVSRGTIDQCRFCGEFTKCVPVSNKPYITNITTLAFNDITVQLDFNDETLPKTVCQACDAKLREMHDFVKVVKAAQESLINVAEPRQVYVEIDPREDYETIVVKTEYDDDEGKDEDDGDDNESREGIVDSLTIGESGETIYIKEAVTQKRKSKTKTASPKKTKKAKVTEVKSETEDAELIIDIKEEVIEIDTNDLESDTGCFLSDTGYSVSDTGYSVSDTGCSVIDTGTDAKPTEVELATSALVFEMRSDGSGYS